MTTASQGQSLQDRSEPNTQIVAPQPATGITGSTMRVKRRNGSFEPVDVNKIIRAVARCCVISKRAPIGILTFAGPWDLCRPVLKQRRGT